MKSRNGIVRHWVIGHWRIGHFNFMVSFPLSLFLIPYAIIVAVVVFLGFISLRNLARYRAEDIISFAAFAIFLIGLVIIAYLSYQYLSPINWKELVEINIFRKGF